MRLLSRVKQLEVHAARHWELLRPSLTPEQVQRAKAIIARRLADPMRRDAFLRVLESGRRLRGGSSMALGAS